MTREFCVDLTDSFIDRIADFIVAQVRGKDRDLSRLALVFGGQRPRLFLQRALAGRLRSEFLPPQFFSIDDFVATALARRESFGLMGDLDACYLIYRLAGAHAPEVLATRPEFAQFLPWAREILGFIEQLDLQGISSVGLKDIPLHAEIGYEVPESINTLLKRIVVLREAFHRSLRERGIYTRGFIYYRAAETIEDVSFEDFDEILFCNFFYLHKTEERIMARLREAGKARFFFQGAPADWPVLDSVARELKCVFPQDQAKKPGYELFLHAGFDRHSQICALRDVLKTVQNFEKTVIVLPDPAAVMPLLSEIASFVPEFNVSMGYPIVRSSVCSLFEAIFETQASRKGERYYAKDYLRVLSHPLIKNCALGDDPSVTRILVHKIEEVFLGIEPASLSGHLFATLKEISEEGAIFKAAAEMSSRMDFDATPAVMKTILGTLHDVLFHAWEDVPDMRRFSVGLERLLDLLLSGSFLEKYPFHLKVMEKLYAIAAQLRHAAFSAERFSAQEIFKVFRNKLENDTVAFSGSSLKGLQILGLLETRALNFDQVLILDVNESILPKVKIHEPLIPRDVMIGLGLDRLEKEEEIQRYQFLRLIGSAKRVDLFYAETDEKHRSRFVEELIWEREKEAGALGAVPVAQPRFHVTIQPSETFIEKTAGHLEALGSMRFSASSLDTYLRCPLRFFYQYVLGLKEKEDLLAEPEAVDVGNFIHGFLEDMFKTFLGRRPELDQKFESRFFEELQVKFDREFARKMSSDAFLVKEVLRVRLGEFLKAERERPVAALLGVEKVYEEEVVLGRNRLRVKAKVDRLDRLEDGSLLVVDYKTGSTEVMPQSARKLEGLALSRPAIKKTVKSFQLPLYYHLAEKVEGGTVNAALYYLRHAERESGFKKLFHDEDGPDARREAMAAYLGACDFIAKEIFDPSVPFAPDMEDPAVCGHCPFFYLCR